MVPGRKQIQQGLTRLELWIDRTSLLLTAMRMTFPNADTKLMVFENVVVNGPVDPKVFAEGDARSGRSHQSHLEQKEAPSSPGSRSRFKT